MILFDGTIFKINLNYKLSYLLIPLIYFLYIYHPHTRKYILYHIVCIGIIGTIDTLYSYSQTDIGFITAFISTIIHVSLLIVLFHFKKYGEINKISIFLLLIANCIILILPYWPYSIKRESTLFLYNLIYVLLYLQKIIS